MEIKDLMIGDLVLVNGTPRKIQGIDSLDSEIIADGEIYTIINDRCHSEDNVSGIPLTQKNLEKNGFKFNNLPFVLGWEQFGLTLCPEGDGYVIGCGVNVAMHIDYFHQLQHALKLCGIEQEIKL